MWVSYLPVAKCTQYNFIWYFVSALQKVGSFPRDVWFPPPIKSFPSKHLSTILLKMALITNKLILPRPKTKMILTYFDISREYRSTEGYGPVPLILGYELCSLFKTLYQSAVLLLKFESKCNVGWSLMFINILFY